MKYLDSNFFIYPILYPEDKKSASVKEALVNIAGGKMGAATSALTWDEFSWAIRKKLGIEAAKREGRKLLGFPNIKILKVDETALGTAQELVDDYGLKPRDAIHAACCMENGISEIISDDPHFDKVDGIRRIALEMSGKIS